MAKRTSTKSNSKANGSRSKTAKRKKTASAKRPARRRTRDESVTVRMYRQGLGDCFLLGFPKSDGGRFHMLIDCGILIGTRDQDAMMRKVAEDIKKTTKGCLDLLVVTHEHWDHVSGFLQASEVFRSMSVDALWLAWTEQEGHPLADKLRRHRERQKRTLRMALAHAGESEEVSLAETRDSIRELLEFFGDMDLGARQGTADALSEVRALVEGPLAFRRPGEVCELPGVEGVRVFVLGPPENERLLKKSNPTKRGKEVYELMFQPGDGEGFLAALAAAEASAAAQEAPFASRRFHPFDQQWGIPVEAAKSKDSAGDHRYGDYFRKHYFDDDPVHQAQRIDHDWLSMAVDLALKLDSDTNNTSLVLAIELEERGRVLLFPGDAQVGNWLSWHDITAWKDGNGDESTSPNLDELLARTVLYKVGHHGSHNATLRELGLEKMTSPELIALIPVDERKALSKRPYPWHMPFKPLYKRLIEKSSGRVLRSDAGSPQKPTDVAQSLWDAFTQSVESTDLYLELEILLPE